MLIHNPKPNTQFQVLNDRLALYHMTKDHEEYWKEYWNDDYFNRLIQDAEEGRMGEFELYAFKFLKKDHVILEAGCGPAHIIHGLQRKGFNRVIGVDYESKVVREVNKRLPHLNVKEGNVFSLQMEDSSLDAYLSFGVVEHFTEGPHAILKEARRVLKNGGIAMISVPYLNKLRSKQLQKLKANSSTTNSQGKGMFFHQYYYSISEFKNILEDNGLSVLETFPYASYAFLTREHPMFRKFWHSPLSRHSLRGFLKRKFYYATKAIRFRYGHMCMFVCKNMKKD